jgi:hypothetical protein
MAQLEGIAGARTLAAGQSGAFRLGTQAELVTGQATGKYTQAVVSGKVFAAATAASGVAPGTAIGTTAAYSLYNPQGSGYNLILLGFSLGYVSGTLGAGMLNLIGHLSPSQAAHSGTGITARNCLVGNSSSGVGLAFTTATVPASGVILATLADLQASLASTAVAPWSVWTDLDGMFAIAPGAGVSIQGTAAAGSSPLVCIGLVWEERAA